MNGARRQVARNHRRNVLLPACVMSRRVRIMCHNKNQNRLSSPCSLSELRKYASNLESCRKMWDFAIFLLPPVWTNLPALFPFAFVSVWDRRRKRSQPLAFSTAPQIFSTWKVFPICGFETRERANGLPRGHSFIPNLKTTTDASRRDAK